MKRFPFFFTLLAAVVSLTSEGAPFAYPDFLPEERPLPQKKFLRKSELKFSDGGRTFQLSDFVGERSLNGIWKISKPESSDVPFDDEPSEFSDVNFDDSSWTQIGVPLDWYIKFPELRDNRSAFALFGRTIEDASSQGRFFPYTRAWYRKTIDLAPEEREGKRVLLHFGVVGYAGKLFINGREAGTHTGDFIPWKIDITELLKPGKNQLALRVDSDYGRIFGGLPKVTRTYGSQWGKSNIRAGLWRDVSLEFRPEIKFNQILLDPDPEKGRVLVRCEIENTTGKEIAGTLLHALTDAESPAGTVSETVETGSLHLKPGINRKEWKIPVSGLKNWSFNDPNLYFLTLAFRDRNRRILSADAVRFGMRSFKVSGNDFYLNGKKIYLFGENIASINYEGRNPDSDADREKIRNTLTAFWKNGCNIIRNGHMPMPEYYAEIADEIGMMLYNEWSWCFTGQIDEKPFEENNLREFKEWILRDYNHPSVVMYSGGNEIENGTSAEVPRQLDKQVDLLRSIDRSGRPICSFSGNGLPYVPKALKGDFLDAHVYYGLSHMSWTLSYQAIRNNIVGAMRKIYQDGETLKRPLIIWEYSGFSWGDQVNQKAPLGTIADYLKYAAEANRTSVGSPKPIGYAGSIGVEAALRKGNAWARGHMGKRLSELFRQIPEVKGIAPWYQDPDLKISRIWNQPVLVGLRHEKSLLPPHNLFSGKPFARELYIVNSTGLEFRNLKAVISVSDREGVVRNIDEIPFGNVPPWSNTAQLLTLTIPEEIKAGCRLMISLKNQQDKEISRNFYDLELQEISILTEAVPVEQKISVVDHGGKSSIHAVEKILKELSIPYEIIPPRIEMFSKYDWVIIPPCRTGEKTMLPDSASLLKFIREGGNILQLEQIPEAPGLFDAVAAVGVPNSLVDICVWDHPIFAGISREAFDLWDNPDAGLVIRNALLPVGRTSLAARGPFMHQRGVFSAVNEARLGRGRILSSQLEATSLWGIDSAASRYLRNLFSYISGGRPVAGTPQLENLSVNNYNADPEALVSIDLSRAANRSFSDEIDNDGRGGWTDQGRNDFRMMPLGDVQAAGVRFRIIDPERNHGKACVILRGGQRKNFPDRATGIPVHRKFGRIFFLHASAWGVKGQEVGRYRIHYVDGRSIDHILIEGRNIGDWWNCVNLPDARIGIARNADANRSIGLCVTAWNNPRPDVEIKSLDFLTAGAAATDKVDYIPADAGVPILVAATGEIPSARNLRLGINGEMDFDPVAKNGPKPVISWDDSDADDVPENAVKVSIPGKGGRPGYTGAVILRFPAETFAIRNVKLFSLRIYSEKEIELKLELPEKEWKGAFSYNLKISGKKEWQQINIPWNEFQKRGSVTEKNLRGEFLIHGSGEDVVFSVAEMEFK